MPINKIDASNNWSYVKGATLPDLPCALGPTPTSSVIQDGKFAHYAGLSPSNSVNPSTIALRAFFEDSKFPWDVGYAQFGAVTACGTPVPPEAVPSLFSRRWYTSPESKPIFLDFMGPEDAHIRFSGADVNFPFYPLNAGLYRQFTKNWPSYDTYCWHPMPNGSVRRSSLSFIPQNSKPSATAVKAAKASVRTAISPLQLTEAALAPFCGDDAESLVINVTMEPKDVDELVFADLVLRLYRDQSDETPGNVVDIQAVGSYLLLEFDENGGGLVLAARIGPQGDNRWIRIWEISQDAYLALVHDATLDLLNSVGNWMVHNNINPEQAIERPPDDQRGWSGLNRPHGLAYWPGGFCLQFLVRSVAYAFSSRAEPRPLSGIETVLTWTFNPIDESLELGELQPFQLVKGFDQCNAALVAYQGAVAKPPEEDHADESAFLLGGTNWYDDAPPFPEQPQEPQQPQQQ